MNPELIKRAVTAWQQARVLHKAGQFRDAEPLYRQALKVMPRSAELLVDYGHLAEDLRDWRAAENIWRAAMQAAPERALGDHLGLALLQQNRVADALPVLEQHQQRQPNDAASLINLAVCYSQLQRDDDALAALRQAVQRRPEYALARESLITLLINRGDRAGAGAALAEARKALPDNPELRYMQMEHLLKSGDWAGGFDLFAARWHTRFVNAVVRLPTDRLWQGEPFEGRLLVRAEQGIGDELLYGGLLPDLQQRHANTLVDCDPRLLPLFARSFPELDFIPRLTADNDPARRYDRQCLMGDLPQWLRRSARDFPVTAGWAKPDPERLAQLTADYRQRFPGVLRVGISWRSSHPGNGIAKSLTLERLRPLLAVPGVQFFNLQYGEPGAEIAAFAAATGIALYQEPSVDPTADLDGLATEIAAMDLVISTSNSTVHLAGALGVPTWILLHRDHGLPWYWGYDGETTPWYPATRLLRCRVRGEWDPVIATAADRLRVLLARAGNT